ncbi:MAG TPA: aminotransferase class I/II-fold pyridoxal phosphate-dependent enzyme [Acidimicrobiales bacterium]|nr:aminotransferase class I/II-fold pyridoxal phosphate-dependent enzyme [Acidimicrobiales bacterium]
MTEDLDPATIAILAGRDPAESSLAPVIYPTTVFESDSVADARRVATDPTSNRFYSRNGNPTVAAFEQAIARMEGAETARAYGSGMGAVTGVVLALCSSGDHIVTQRQLYSVTQLVFQALCPRFGIEVTFVDGTDPEAFAAAVEPGRTMLVWAETPANPCLDLVDLDALGAIAGPVTAVDSTFATPFGIRPLEHGVDLVVHSGTKGIGGHNDATIGVVAGSAELVGWLRGFAILQGAVASPYDAANALRGLRSLSARLDVQCATAQALAEMLEAHPRAAAVRYPGLDSHPQRELARSQMDRMGAMISFEVVGGLEAGSRFVEALTIARMATSLGGPETLVTHPASTTHVSLTPEELEANGIGPGTIRVSVGLEAARDLIADFAQALDGR